MSEEENTPVVEETEVTGTYAEGMAEGFGEGYDEGYVCAMDDVLKGIAGLIAAAWDNEDATEEQKKLMVGLLTNVAEGIEDGSLVASDEDQAFGPNLGGPGCAKDAF